MIIDCLKHIVVSQKYINRKITKFTIITFNQVLICMQVSIIYKIFKKWSFTIQLFGYLSAKTPTGKDYKIS